MQSNSLELVGYSGTSSPIENVGGNDAGDNIDNHEEGYFQSDIRKHSHLWSKDLEQTGHESTIPSTADMTSINLTHLFL